jgi:acetyltransferase-like isoleucine patch superfamily enzyme
VNIGERCWLGMNAIILPGVTLGPYTVVAAGAVVTRSFHEGHCILMGMPARPSPRGQGGDVSVVQESGVLFHGDN